MYYWKKNQNPTYPKQNFTLKREMCQRLHAENCSVATDFTGKMLRYYIDGQQYKTLS